MSETCVTVPFTVPGLYAGWAEGLGLAKATPTELVLEFVVRDGVVQLLKSGVKEIRIPRSEVAAVTLKQNWFRTRVLIRVQSIKWLSDLPGADTGEVALHIARKHRGDAAAFVQYVNDVATLPSAY